MKHVRLVHPTTGQPASGVLKDELIQSDGGLFSTQDVRLLAPCTPTKIICVGRNYVDHAKELGNPVPEKPMLFLKPPSAVIGPEDPIVLPDSDEVHFEGELAVVIGRTCRHVSASDAPGVIFGYTCLNDVSDRVAQRWEKNWVRAKAFDTSAPLGPVVVTPDEIAEPFRIRTRRNGDVCQDGSTRDLIFPISLLIETISSVMTLMAGDVIATGTPAGVGPLAAGDVVEVEIDGIGILRNPVQAGRMPPRRARLR